MAAAPKRAGDLTGRAAEKLTKENAEELERRAKEISMMTAAEAEEKKEIVDLTAKPQPRKAEPVTVKETERTIRVRETLEDVVIGQGNWYTFEGGRQYKVPAFVADHLEEKGLLWH